MKPLDDPFDVSPIPWIVDAPDPAIGDAFEDAKKGISTTAAVVSTATTVASSSVGGAVLGALGVSAAVASSIPVVGWIAGAALAVAAAFTALGEWLTGKKKAFKPSAADAEAWLTLFRLDPAVIFSHAQGGGGIDELQTPDQAARLVRFFKIVSGEVKLPPGKSLPEHPATDASCDVPYLCAVDPNDPLTDPAFLAKVKREGQYNVPVELAVKDPAHARALLNILRREVKSGALQSALSWTQAIGIHEAMRLHVKKLLALAGETKRDAELEKVFGDLKVGPLDLSVAERVEDGMVGRVVSMLGPKADDCGPEPKEADPVYHNIWGFKYKEFYSDLAHYMECDAWRKKYDPASIHRSDCGKKPDANSPVYHNIWGFKNREFDADTAQWKLCDADRSTLEAWVKHAKQAPFCVVGPDGSLHCVKKFTDVGKKRVELGLVGRSFREDGKLQHVQCNGTLGPKPPPSPCPPHT